MKSPNPLRGIVAIYYHLEFVVDGDYVRDGLQICLTDGSDGFWEL